MLQELVNNDRPVQALGKKRQRAGSDCDALCKRRQIGASRRPMQGVASSGASDEAGWEEELLAAEAMALLSAQTGPSSQAAGCDDLAEVCPCQPLALHA